VQRSIRGSGDDAQSDGFLINPGATARYYHRPGVAT
jgi:hypothetical protein